MATTTNYGWTTPDDTALVKDGASAIRSLGTSVDTTTKNLNPETTLGDIAYRSSTANVKTRLGIGSTGNVLTVSGGVPTWAAPAGGGGMTLLSTTTLSGASTTISSISGDYINLVLVISDPTNATAGNIRIAPNGDTTLALQVFIENVGGSIMPNVAGVDSGRIFGQYSYNSSTTSADGALTLTINNYAKSHFKNFSTSYFSNITQGNTFLAGGSFGSYRSASAITSLVISPSAGSFTGGTALVYGVK
jgi:hypothetical protein